MFYPPHPYCRINVEDSATIETEVVYCHKLGKSKTFGKQFEGCVYPTICFFPKNYNSEGSTCFLFSTLSLSVYSKKHKSSVPQRAWQESRGSSFTEATDLELFCSSGKHRDSGYKTEPDWLCSPGKMQSEALLFLSLDKVFPSSSCWRHLVKAILNAEKKAARKTPFPIPVYTDSPTFTYLFSATINVFNPTTTVFLNVRICMLYTKYKKKKKSELSSYFKGHSLFLYLILDWPNK